MRFGGYAFATIANGIASKRSPTRGISLRVTTQLAEVVTSMEAVMGQRLFYTNTVSVTLM
jgi:hypothetical protein